MSKTETDDALSHLFCAAFFVRSDFRFGRCNAASASLEANPHSVHDPTGLVLVRRAGGHGAQVARFTFNGWSRIAFGRQTTAIGIWETTLLMARRSAALSLRGQWGDRNVLWAMSLATSCAWFRMG